MTMTIIENLTVTEAQEIIITDYRHYVRKFKRLIKAATMLRKLQKLRARVLAPGFNPKNHPGLKGHYLGQQMLVDEATRRDPDTFDELLRYDNYHTYREVKHGMSWGLRAHITNLLEERARRKAEFKEWLNANNLA
jgi:hypothetical protein